MCNLLVLLQDDYYIVVMNFPAITLGGVLAGSLVFLMGTWQQSLPSFSIVDFHHGECLIDITCIQYFSFFLVINNISEGELMICLMLSKKYK